MINRHYLQKLSIDDYNAFQILTKLEYEAGLIKEQSPSELLRYTMRRLLNQLRDNRVYHLKNNSSSNKAQNQQLYNQAALQSSESQI